LPTAGTAPVSASTSAWPPAFSSSPRERRCSVTVAVEVLGPQALLDHQAVEGAVPEQDRAEDGLLGLDRMWWRRPDRRGLSVAV
jgi:hypothetical protein